MKRMGIVLMLLTLAAPGCLPMPVLPDQSSPAVPAKEKEKETAAPPAPVKAEDIDETNAHAKATALQAECDRALGDARPDGKPLKIRP